MKEITLLYNGEIKCLKRNNCVKLKKETQKLISLYLNINGESQQSNTTFYIYLIDYRGLNQTVLKLLSSTATTWSMSIMSTILRWFGDVYLIIDWVLLKKLQTQSHSWSAQKRQTQSHGWSAQKMAETESRLVCSKKWQTQSHGWSAQKMADTESRLVCSKKGRHWLTDWLTDRLTDRFHRYIVVRFVNVTIHDN